MHKLPPRLLSCLFCRGQLVVLGDVAVECPEKDHRHHARQEEHDHQGVQDREPVDVAPGHLQVGVPPRCPAVGTVSPLHVVREDDLADVVDGSARRRVLALACGSKTTRVSGIRLHVGLRQTVRLNFKANDSVVLSIVFGSVMLEEQPHVVVDVVSAAVLVDQADRESVIEREVLPFWPGLAVASGSGEVVDNPVHQVLVLDHAPELVLLRRGELLLAQHLAALVVRHADLVGGVLDLVPDEELSQILNAVRDRVWLAVPQNVVPIRQLRLHRCQLVDLQLHRSAVFVLNGCHARQVEGPTAAAAGSEQGQP
mmetsp:Transcript_34090/g.79203  ORF Transcript_34090/g.79203 Transcript_34090/m.79203 type:complete len:312 (+) Transcript_34090:1141-2076(+)